MSNTEKFTGRVWVLGDDIDTDIIIPTEYLALPTVEDMKQYGFSPLRPELAAQIKEGDIIVAGKNFGCGSSREQAPEIIKALKIKCVIAKSYARIFFRNSINNGLLLIENSEIQDVVKEGDTSPSPWASPSRKTVRSSDSPSPAEPDGYHQCRRSGEGHAETKRHHIGGVDMGYTLIEKIIKKNIGADHVEPGQIVTVNVDRVMIHDIFIPFVADKFEEMGFQKLWDPDKVVLIYDHLVPTSAVEDVRHFKIGDAFADKYGLTHVHRSDGICHQLMTEKGYAKPGNIVFGTDSHTTTYGCVGCFSSGIGYTEMAAILGTGKCGFVFRRRSKWSLTVHSLQNVSAKDVILRLIGDLRADGATYKALEITGSTVDAMSVASRMTISNMAIEAGAKACLFRRTKRPANIPAYPWKMWTGSTVTTMPITAGL